MINGKMLQSIKLWLISWIIIHKMENIFSKVTYKKYNRLNKKIQINEKRVKNMVTRDID